MRLREYATKMGLSYQAAWKQFKNNYVKNQIKNMFEAENNLDNKVIQNATGTATYN